ncbi:MAG: peptidoglycan DD-metalloendopeptidase family protein [Gammaproteobacteria bacterium]
MKPLHRSDRSLRHTFCRRWALCVLAALSMTAHALPPAGGGKMPIEAPTDSMSTEQRDAIARQIDTNLERLEASGRLPEARAGAVSFQWPLAAGNELNDAGYHGISNFVDQNPSAPNALLDYNCGARTYDLSSGYNHRGIDFFTWPFGWQKMDDDEVSIVAAAPGVIALKSDDNFDRQCTFNSSPWNAVYVRHADNSITWYGHMKAGSLTAKDVGDSVSAGEVLGVVGSSGSSTGPHLHMETYDGDGNLIEPYAGACNNLNANSWWSDQRSYYDSALNALTTGFAPPAFPTCPSTNEQPNTRRVFAPGETIHVAAFYRDQLIDQTTTYTVRYPDGTVILQWTHNSNAPHYAASYWYWLVQPSSAGPFGTWTFSAEYEGTTTVQEFDVVSAGTDSDSDGVQDHLDNCMVHANASQIDADGDGFGNACDADFNNDGIVNVIDLGTLRTAFFSTNALTDLNADGTVNVVDLGVLRTLFFQPPGPSAYAP